MATPQDGAKSMNACPLRVRYTKPSGETGIHGHYETPGEAEEGVGSAKAWFLKAGIAGVDIVIEGNPKCQSSAAEEKAPARATTSTKPK